MFLETPRLTLTEHWKCVWAVMSQRASMNVRVVPRREWRCPFSRDQLLELWGVKSEQELQSDDERKAWRLLKKYSGSLQDYMEYDAAAAARRILEARGVSDGAGKHINFEKRGRRVTTDIDARSREVLREIDKVCFNSNSWVSSAVLHMSDQKFPTRVLRLELERELDRLLREQMMERERMVRRTNLWYCLVAAVCKVLEPQWRGWLREHV